MALPAPVGVVDLDDTAQRRLIVTRFHDLQQFVLDPPRGQRGDAQMTFKDLAENNFLEWSQPAEARRWILTPI